MVIVACKLFCWLRQHWLLHGLPVAGGSMMSRKATGKPCTHQIAALQAEEVWLMGRAEGHKQLVADRYWHDCMRPTVFLKAKTGVFLMQWATAYMVRLSDTVSLHIISSRFSSLQNV
jgi:hypothetical protein